MSETIIDIALEREGKYDWLGAAESYKKSLNSITGQSFGQRAWLSEALGYAFYRAGMQGETPNEFKEKMKQALTNYLSAKESYRRLGDQARGKEKRCRAMLAYIRYWLAPEMPEKRSSIEETWRLAKEAMVLFKEDKSYAEYVKTFIQLGLSAGLTFALRDTWQTREETLREGVEHGEKAISFSKESQNPSGQAKIYVITATFVEAFNFYFLDVENWEKHSLRARDYWQKGTDLSEETALLELSNPLSHPLTDILGWGHGSDAAIRNFGRVLERCEKTRDKLMIGTALAALSFHAWWKTVAAEDLSKREELAKAFASYDEKARKEYGKIAFTSPQPLYPECFWQEALLAPDLANRGSQLEKVVEEDSEELKLVEHSEDSEATSGTLCKLSQELAVLAKTKSSAHERKRILQQSMDCATRALQIKEKISPPMHWSQAVNRNLLANTKRELAEITEEIGNPKTILEESIREKEAALKLADKFVLWMVRSYGTLYSDYSLFLLGSWQYEYGEILSAYHTYAEDGDPHRKAAAAFMLAAETLQKLKTYSRVAECYWRAAQTYHDLAEHLKASECFALSSDSYRSAEQRIPQLSDLYRDLALQAFGWSEVEKALYLHARQEYGAARESYRNAAATFKSTERSGHFAPNCEAWSELESAEDLTQREQTAEGIEAFESAAKLFKNSMSAFQVHLSQVKQLDEIHTLRRLIVTSEMRELYCRAEIDLQEAKILDARNDNRGASEKYGEAIEVLTKTLELAETEYDRREIQLLLNLSKAQQAMTKGEADAAPEQYLAASQLFERAAEISSNEKTKMLLLGHSQLSKALESGARFSETADATLRAKSLQYLENANKYYVKGGFRGASAYAKASKLVFESYTYMNDASKESDPQKKSRLFLLAEKTLQTAANAYAKADQPARRDHVLSLLDNVREERELAVSLTEILQDPLVVPAVTTLTIPALSSEKAAGLERFVTAELLARVIVPRKKVMVGGDVEVEIELANAGRGPAQLMKLEDLYPNGFELVTKPDLYRFEENYLNLKGKRLNPLQTEELKFVFRPRMQGVFTLHPRILYYDENGKSKTHNPEPVEITVKELGVSGWIKGNRV